MLPFFWNQLQCKSRDYCSYIVILLWTLSELVHWKKYLVKVFKSSKLHIQYDLVNVCNKKSEKYYAIITSNTNKCLCNMIKIKSFRSTLLLDTNTSDANTDFMFFCCDKIKWEKLNVFFFFCFVNLKIAIKTILLSNVINYHTTTAKATTT